MFPFLALVAFVVVAVTVLLYQHKKEQQRREQLALFAMSKGWTFEPVDARGLAERWSDAPFGQGHSRKASNVFTGTIGGRPMIAFDYRYKITTSNGKSSSTRTYHFGVSVIGLPAYLPRLDVLPENVLTRFGNALGLDDVELESEDFNRAFRVGGAPKFAHDVLTPRVMELLLRGGCPSLRITGTEIMGWDDERSDPGELIARVETLSQLVAAVPSFVWKDHGYDPGQDTTAPGGAP